MPPPTHPTITLHTASGQPVEIVLVAVPGAGLRWHAPDVPAGCVLAEVEPESAGEGIGGPARQRFRLTASMPGTHTLAFEYRRPWEPVVRAVQPVTVVVR